MNGFTKNRDPIDRFIKNSFFRFVFRAYIMNIKSITEYKKNSTIIDILTLRNYVRIIISIYVWVKYSNNCK